ncbi:MAG: rhodanese-like domain-containing protein [Candidatus Promineofilum sp.]|jgi:hydroxyacylglutathione hydrolase|nr:rhodanese-like domain-containing protein [Promineifilum sp.]
MKANLWPLLAVVVLTLGLLVACGGQETAAPAVEEIDLTTLADSVDAATVNAVKDNPGVFLIDVREPDEYAAGHIPGITLIPMGEVAARLAELPRDKEIIVTCRTGNRSGQVADLLREQGFTNVHNMSGGIVAWEEAGYPVEQ